MYIYIYIHVYIYIHIYVYVCCIAMQSVAGCCRMSSVSVLHSEHLAANPLPARSGLCCRVSQCVAVAVPRSPHLAASQSLAWWSLVLQSVAVCCSLLSVFLCEHLAAKSLLALRSFVLQSVAACVAACAALCCGVSCVLLCENLAATQWLARRSLVLQSVAVCCSHLPLHRPRPRPLSLCLFASLFWDIFILCLQLEGCSRSDMSHSMTHSNLWHLSVTRLSNMGIQPPGHDSFIFVTWLTHVCDVTHSYVWHDAFIHVTHHMVINVTWHMDNWCHYSCVSQDSVKWSSLIHGIWIQGGVAS